MIKNSLVQPLSLNKRLLYMSQPQMSLEDTRALYERARHQLCDKMKSDCAIDGIIKHYATEIQEKVKSLPFYSTPISEDQIVPLTRAFEQLETLLIASNRIQKAAELAEKNHPDIIFPSLPTDLSDEKNIDYLALKKDFSEQLQGPSSTSKVSKDISTEAVFNRLVAYLEAIDKDPFYGIEHAKK